MKRCVLWVEDRCASRSCKHLLFTYCFNKSIIPLILTRSSQWILLNRTVCAESETDQQVYQVRIYPHTRTHRSTHIFHDYHCHCEWEFNIKYPANNLTILSGKHRPCPVGCMLVVVVAIGTGSAARLYNDISKQTINYYYVTRLLH